MKAKSGVPFIKMHGIGNDYIYIDALRGETPHYLKESRLPDLSRKISDRHFGVGSDGLIVILPSDIADFRMRIFNADGSEAKMCGNGIRCVGKYVRDLGFTTKNEIDVESASGVKHLSLVRNANETERVIVGMGSPFFRNEDIPTSGERGCEAREVVLMSRGEDFKVTPIGMGNPHGVIFVKNVDELNLSAIGPELENSPFWPDRANIEFVEVLNRGELKVRVWERGSGETWACGTGACASVVASFRKGLSDSDVRVNLRGGTLQICYDETSNSVTMTGPAEFIAKGEFFIP